MSLTAGTRLGPYELVSPIGAGGMGEVYRARDPRLGRDVAIKVLPAGVSRDPDRLRRFEQEARAASLLNHPNIVVLFDVGTAGELPYVVGELLDGETLREKLRAGPLPVRKAVEYTRQIAEGLAAAHAKGIVHRDLKPENVFVTRDGVVKLLDFGLAKLKPDLAPAGDTTVAGAIGTTPGLLLGTVGYMAPEQVRGDSLDHRADIFSLGAILYELLAGRRAFGGDAMPDTLSAILHTDPPSLTTIRSDVPLSLDRVIHRCLEKDPADRYQSARDLAFSLEALSSDAGRTVDIGTSRRRRWPLPAVAAGVAIGLIVSAIPLAILRRTTRDEPAPSAVRVHRLTDLVGLEESPAIAPDGKSVAFTANVESRRQIFQRLVSGGVPLQITRDPVDHLFPRWTPDSSAIIYYAPPTEPNALGTLWEISAFGGAPRRVANSLGGADVSHDGKRVAFVTPLHGETHLVTAARDGSAIQPVTRIESPPSMVAAAHVIVRWSPDDHWIAYQGGYVFRNEIFRVRAEGGAPEQLTREATQIAGFTWRSDGSALIYSSARGATVLYLPVHNLWEIRLATREVRQLTVGETGHADPDAGPGGRLVASRVRMRFDVWKFPVDGSATENVRRAVQITRQTSHVQTPSISPSGAELVYLSDSGGHGNLWVADVATGQRRQITSEQDPAVSLGVPVWSPDGRRIAFFSTRNSIGQGGVWLVDPDGSNGRQVVNDGGWTVWSADGRWIYFSQNVAPFHLKKVAPDGGRPLTVRTDGGRPAIGADGTLYYTVELEARGGIEYEIRAARPETAASRLVTRVPARRVPSWQRLHPVISPDGKWLAVPLTDAGTTNLWGISTADGSFRQITDFGDRATFIARRVSWSPDGRAIFAAVGEGDADIVLLDGLRP